jgi:hypothetical protein
MTSDHYAERLAIYDALVAKCPQLERKGKTMPYTSANGYMFSLLNKDGEIGIRLEEGQRKRFAEEHDAPEFRSHGSRMRGYVLVPDHMLEDLDALAVYLNAGFEHVMSLEPK